VAVLVAAVAFRDDVAPHDADGSRRGGADRRAACRTEIDAVSSRLFAVSD
jgi:hypothetical protein